MFSILVRRCAPPRYSSLKPDEIPDTESLATTLDRVLPYWEQEIAADIKGGKRVLVRGSDACGYWMRIGCFNMHDRLYLQ